MRRALAGCVILLALASVAGFVMTFAFAYAAVFSPGVDDDLAGASFLTFVLTTIFGGAAFFGALTVADDDLWPVSKR